jgi:transcriptional regulator with XRE-family HTH domain
MNDAALSAWDGVLGTAGGPAFGSALREYAAARDVDAAHLAAACGMAPAQLEEIFAGTRRVGISALARMVQALRSRPIEFMQKCGMLSLEVYASGLDPLYFLPDGQIRYDARIYMREINPRHPVPEADMTRRNPALKALSEDALLDALGKLEVELAYLLRLAVQQTGGLL